MVDDEVERRLIESIDGIRTGLNASSENAREMQDALIGFEAKIVKLEDAVRPIHDLTQKVTLAQKNINDSLVQFEKIHRHFRTADEMRPVIGNSQLLKSEHKKERERYYKAVEKVCDSYNFLDERRDIRSSEMTLRNLDDLRRFAIDSVCIEFEIILERHAASNMDYDSYATQSMTMALDSSSSSAVMQVDDVVELHSRFPEDVGKRLQEYSACVERCGLVELFVHHYSKSRGKIIEDSMEAMSEKLWMKVGTDQHNSIRSGTTPPSPPPSPSKSQLYDNNSDAGSVTSTSRSKRWKAKLFSKIHRGGSKHRRDSSTDDVVEMHAKKQQQTSSPPSSFSSKQSIVQHGQGQRKLKSYTNGSHGMLKFLEVALYMFEAEMILATNVLPPGWKGRKIFLEAMIEPCEKLNEIGFGAAMEFTHNTYSDTEMVFALLDVLGKMEEVQVGLFEVLSPQSIKYLGEQQSQQLQQQPDSPSSPSRRRSLSATIRVSSSPDRSQNSPVSPRSSNLPDAAWNYVLALFKGWKRETLAKFNEACISVTKPIQKVPESCTIHPQSTKLVQFLRRLTQGSSSTKMIFPNEEKLREVVEKLLSKYIQELTSRPSSIQQTLFGLNNMHYVVMSVLRDENLFTLLEDSGTMKMKQDEVEALKTHYLNSVMQGVMQQLERNENNVLRDKKVAKELGHSVTNWMETTHKLKSRLEVPDYELRTELRFRIRNTLIPKYSTIYEKLQQDASMNKKLDKYFPYEPTVLSTMISQFYELSETTSNVDALIQ